MTNIDALVSKKRSNFKVINNILILFGFYQNISSLACIDLFKIQILAKIKSVECFRNILKFATASSDRALSACGSTA